jgi:tetratricopeptide (TPR) repeat protein
MADGAAPHTYRRTVLFVLAASLLAGGCSSGPDTPLCDRAAALADDAQLGPAAQTYAEARRDREGQCASDGLAAVADRDSKAFTRVAEGQAAEKARDLTTARDRYTEALALDAGNGQAAAGLQRVAHRPSDVGPVWRKAQRLYDEGYHDAARAEIVRVVRTHPDQAVPAPLAALAPDGTTPVVRPSPTPAPTVPSGQTGTAAGSSLWPPRGWGRVVWVVAAVVLAGLALSRLPRRARLRLVAALRRLGPLGRGLARPLGTTVRLDAADGSALAAPLGHSFTALVGEWVHGHAVTDPAVLVQLAPEPTDTNPLPDITALPPPAGVFVWIGQWLWSPDRLTFGATLFPKGMQNGGVAVNLSERTGPPLGQASIWNRRPMSDDTASCARLAPRAAAWLVSTLDGISAGVTPGADGWQRHAAFLAGVEATARGAFDEALVEFRDAQEGRPRTDPHVVAAHLNEAFALLSTGLAGDRAAATEILRGLLAGGTPVSPEITQRARYHLVTAEVDAATAAAYRTTTPPTRVTVDEVTRDARNLVVALRWPKSTPSAGLRHLRSELFGPSVLLLARALALRTTAHPLVARRVDRMSAGDLAVESAARHPNALDHLLVRVAEAEPVSPDDLVAEVVAHVRLPGLGLYELAAYLAQTGAAQDAAGHLAVALSAPVHAARAAHDPALRTLAANPQVGPRFRSLVQPWKDDLADPADRTAEYERELAISLQEVAELRDRLDLVEGELREQEETRDPRSEDEGRGPG